MEWAGWIYAQKTFAFIAIILSFVSVCAFVVFRFSGGKCARVIQAGLVMASKCKFKGNSQYRNEGMALSGGLGAVVPPFYRAPRRHLNFYTLSALS